MFHEIFHYAQDKGQFCWSARARTSQDSSILTVSAVESPNSLCGSNHLFFFKNLHYLSVTETLVLEGDYSLLSIR